MFVFFPCFFSTFIFAFICTSYFEGWLFYSPTAIALGSSAIVKVLGQNLLSDSLWFSGADPSWAAQRFRGRFQQGLTEVPPRLRKFRYLSGLLGQIVLGCQKVPRKVSPRFQQGCTKVPLRFFKFLGVSGSLGQIRFGLPKGSVLKGSVEGSPMFHQGFTEVPPRFHQGRSGLACQKVLWKVPPSLL